jgi:hypothetical protein
MFGSNAFGWPYFGQGFIDPDAEVPFEGDPFPRIDTPGTTSQSVNREASASTILRSTASSSVRRGAVRTPLG